MKKSKSLPARNAKIPRENLLFWLIPLSVQGWALILFLQHAWDTLAYPYSLDYGEGAVLDQVIRLFQGQAIYRTSFAEPPYVINVYPPVYLIAQLPFLQLWGPAFWYGRIISLLSALGIAVFIALTVQRLVGNRAAGVVGGLTFLAIPYIVHWAVLFRIDMLALFLSWVAIYVIVRWPRERWSLLASVLFLVLSIYTRQSYLLAAPLTILCWLWSQTGWKRALSFVGLLAGSVFGLFLLLNLLTKGGFFFNTITVLGKQAISIDIVSYYAEELFNHMPLLVAAAALTMALVFVKTPENNWKFFSTPYLLGAVISAVTIGKPGSNVNYLIEVAAALSTCVALLLVWLKRWPWLHLLVLVLLAAQIYALAAWTRTDYFPTHDAQPHPENAQLLQLIHDSKGPVLTDEYIGLLLLDHRPVYIQPFDFATLSKNGSWDQQPFLDDLDQRAFELIIIYNPFDSLVRQRWTKEMLQHIRQNYELEQHIGDNEIYRRRP